LVLLGRYILEKRQKLLYYIM